MKGDDCKGCASSVVCEAAQVDGITCADDECDYESGVRKRPVETSECKYVQDGWRIETDCGDVFHLDAGEVPPDYCGRCGKVLTVSEGASR